jgi:hypothetical protein
VPEVVALAGTLADAGEDREAAVLLATLLMSSWMTTVLPTPAPPKRPILPPFKNGWMRSMTLMPVSNISSDVDCSSNAGAWRWIGMCSLALTGPSSSTGSPSTLSTRPSVSRPTGTVMPAPVSIAFMPRTMPSVATMAMQRTRPSPRCCCTSTTTSSGAGTYEAVADDAQRLEDGRHLRLFELNVNGRAADRNYFSDVLCHSLSFFADSFSLYSAAAPLTISIISLVMRRLTDAVHGQRERVDQVSCVLGRRIRRGHARRVFGGDDFRAARGRSAS